jgi:hypothetical protein
MKNIKISTILTFILISSFYNNLFAKEIKEVFKQHISILAADSLQGRGIGTKGHKLAEQYLVEQYEKIGLQKIGNSFLKNSSINRNTIRYDLNNIVGVVEGTDPELKNEFIVVGAHYDHLGYTNGLEVADSIYNGANDNASGVAMVLELAKEINKRKNLLKRSVIFVCFDGEESGLLGAKQFLKSNEIENEHIKLYLNFDMIGSYDENKGVSVIALDQLVDAEETFNKIFKEHDVKWRADDLPVFSGTDALEFHNKNIPGIDFFTGIDDYYHKYSDETKYIDFDGLVKIYNAGIDIIREYSLKEEIKKGTISPKERYNSIGKLGIRGGFGSNGFDYVDDFYTAKTKMTGQIGLVGELTLYSSYHLIVGGLYDYSGSEYSEGDVRFHSLTVPVGIRYRQPLDNIPVRPYMQVFGYYKKVLSGTVKNDSDKFDKLFEKETTGIGVGFGIESVAFSFGWDVYWGIDNFHKLDEVQIHEVHSSLSIEYYFLR